ncbi:MAG: protein phosphatase 2C domain-containing protein [Chloroflexi bacterium]|nr:protein phosphatase 2C domain-containing protein [Chloroflexota bacterium]
MGKEHPHPRTEWRAIGQSVRGAAHLRTGLPNQDAIRWLPASGTGPPLILAVSDGHGSPRYFRSHVGSEKAVETAAWMVQDLLDGQPDPTNLSAIKRTAEDRLPRMVVRRWEQAVAEHVTQSPLTPEELDTLEKQKGAAARQAVIDNPALAYGATVLAVLIAETFILYLQLGDGDILVVADDGRVSRPLERDARLFANQTTSLCTPDAWRDVQIRFQAVVDPPPALILLATDGYANSFVSETAFQQVGTDVLEMIRAEGLEAVQESLETWLSEASQAGSGDDITLGILCRADVPSSSQSETSELQTSETDISLGKEDEFTVTVTVKRAKK